MANFVLFDDFGYDLGAKVHNLASDTIKAVLTNSAPNQATGSVIGDVTQISATGGYAAQTLGTVTWAETSGGSGVWQLTSADVTWSASGADYDAFRYIVLYNDTAASDEVIGYLDYGSTVNLTNGNTFTVDVGANGWFQLPIT